MNNEKPPDTAGKFEKGKIKCDKCDGTGKRTFPGQKQAVTCQTCKGTGYIVG